MKLFYSKKFVKQYHKLPKKVQDQFKQRLVIFVDNPQHPSLRNHALQGNYQGFYSINITGDIRALYTKKGSSVIIFGFIGTHSQLYG